MTAVAGNHSSQSSQPLPPTPIGAGEPIEIGGVTLIVQGQQTAARRIWDHVHFEARVVSPSFQGLPTLKRHRLVYATLGSLMGQEIHALGLRTLTPEEQGSVAG